MFLIVIGHSQCDNSVGWANPLKQFTPAGPRMKILPKLERKLRRLKKRVTRTSLVRKLDLVHERWDMGILLFKIWLYNFILVPEKRHFKRVVRPTKIRLRMSTKSGIVCPVSYA